MASNVVHIRAVFESQRALKAFGEAMAIVEDKIEDQPWDEDLKAIRKRLRYAAKRLMPQVRGDK